MSEFLYFLLAASAGVLVWPLVVVLLAWLGYLMARLGDYYFIALEAVTKLYLSYVRSVLESIADKPAPKDYADYGCMGDE